MVEVDCCATCDHRDSDYDPCEALSISCKKYEIITPVWAKCDLYENDGMQELVDAALSVKE